IVRTAWNATVVDELERGARKILDQYQIKKVKVLTVPGAIELPFGVKNFWELAKKKSRPDAFVVLGCVIRGGTPHFDYVCRAVTDGVVQLNLQLPVPVIFGVLTVDNELQATERIGGSQGHKGEEAALSALQMIAYVEQNRNRK
ncbi:MAG TPA: 6,7-dimethyl-8-ribityllumazine synthase, partial [Flavitalea sp.]|nr:6,7-dimethyl-8-ribityllumazine synthase [Flavitalea sp.]